MTKTVVIDVDINSNIDEATEGFTRLQTQIKNTRIELQKAEEAGDEVTFNKLKGDLDELNDQLEKVTLKSKKFEDALADVPGPAGAVGKAIQGVDSAFKMLIANPIIAVVAAVAAGLMLMYKSLNSSAEGQATLKKLTDATTKALAPLLALIQTVAIPVFNAFADVISWVGDKFNQFAQWLGISQEKIDEINSNINEEEKKKLEEAKKREEQLAEQRKRTAEANLKTLIDGLEAAKKVLMEDRKREQYEVKERYRALYKLNNANKEQLLLLKAAELKELGALTKKYNEEDIKLAEEFTKKLGDISTASIKDQTERAKSARKEKYREDVIALEKDKQFIKLSEESKNTYRAQLKEAYDNDIAKIERDAAIKAIDDKLAILQMEGETLQKGTREQWANRLAVLNELEQKEILQAEDKEEQITAIQEKYAEKRKQLKRDELEANAMTIAATVRGLATLGNAIASSYDEEAKTSQAAFEKRKNLLVATTVMNAAAGIIEILAAKSTLPSPFDWIVKGINAAALGISAGVQIANIKKTTFSSSGGGSTSVSSATPTSNAASIPAPVIAASQANSQGNLGNIIAGSINNNNSQSRPIQAYVVAGQVNTQQQLDRRISTAARLGG